MSAGKLSLSRPACVGIALLVLAIMAMLLFRMEDNYHIGLLLSTCGLAWVGALPFRQWTRIDWILSLITVYELFSCYWAECMAPAIFPAFYAVFGWTVYFLLRRILAEGSIFYWVVEGGLIPIGIALLLAIGSFYVFRHSVKYRVCGYLSFPFSVSSIGLYYECMGGSIAHSFRMDMSCATLFCPIHFSMCTGNSLFFFKGGLYFFGHLFIGGAFVDGNKTGKNTFAGSRFDSHCFDCLFSSTGNENNFANEPYGLPATKYGRTD